MYHWTRKAKKKSVRCLNPNDLVTSSALFSTKTIWSPLGSERINDRGEAAFPLVFGRLCEDSERYQMIVNSLSSVFGRCCLLKLASLLCSVDDLQETIWDLLPRQMEFHHVPIECTKNHGVWRLLVLQMIQRLKLCWSGPNFSCAKMLEVHSTLWDWKWLIEEIGHFWFKRIGKRNLNLTWKSIFEWKRTFMSCTSIQFHFTSCVHSCSFHSENLDFQGCHCEGCGAQSLLDIGGRGTQRCGISGLGPIEEQVL